MFGKGLNMQPTISGFRPNEGSQFRKLVAWIAPTANRKIVRTNFATQLYACQDVPIGLSGSRM